MFSNQTAMKKSCRFVLCLACVFTGEIAGAAVTRWQSLNDGLWNDQGNWTDGAPTSSDDAQHAEKASNITIANDAECNSFEGKGTLAPADRNVVVDSSKSWTIGSGGLFKNTSGNAYDFPVYIKDGTSGDPTEIQVQSTGNINGIVFRAAPHAAYGDYISIQTADGDFVNSDLLLRDHVTIDVGDDVESATIAVRDYADIDIGGDVFVSHGTAPDWTISDYGDVDIVGDLSGINLSIGAVSTSTGTTVNIGSAGDNSPIVELWELSGLTNLTINGDFLARGDAHVPRVVLNDGASMTVAGDTSSLPPTGLTYDATWLLNDDSVFNGSGPIIGGTWTVAGNARVVANSDVLQDSAGRASWSTTSDGNGAGTYGIKTNAEFSPGSLVVDGGGTVSSLHLGFDDEIGIDVDGVDNHPVWDMTISDGSTVEIRPGGRGWHHGEVRYEGSHNTYRALRSDPDPEPPYLSHAASIELNGPLVNVGSNSTLTIELHQATSATNYGYVDVQAELVAFNGSGDLDLLEFDTERVTLDFYSHSCSAGANHLELFSPDLDLNTDDPFFEDSPCLKRWGDVRVHSGPDNSCTRLIDIFKNTPIGGGSDDFFGSPNPYPDALYVVNLWLEAPDGGEDTVMYTAGHQIYYTSNYTLGSGASISGPAPIKLELTSYGDFDADKYEEEGVGDCDDIAFFNATLFKEYGEESEPESGVYPYNPLADWNCDGRIDCDDYCRFGANWPTSGSGCTLSSVDDDDGSCSCN